MSPHTIRDARHDDREAIAAIYNEAIAEGRSTFETQRRTAADIDVWFGSPRHPVFVAEHNGAIAGWARIAPYSTRPCYATIAEASVYVRSNASGHGIGNALTDALRQCAQDTALTKLLGKCLTTNQAATKLVARHGFRAVGIHLCHGQIKGQWHDVLLVELLLQPTSDRRHLDALGLAAVESRDEERRTGVTVTTCARRAAAVHDDTVGRVTV